MPLSTAISCHVRPPIILSPYAARCVVTGILLQMLLAHAVAAPPVILGKAFSYDFVSEPEHVATDLELLDEDQLRLLRRSGELETWNHRKRVRTEIQPGVSGILAGGGYLRITDRHLALSGVADPRQIELDHPPGQVARGAHVAVARENLLAHWVDEERQDLETDMPIRNGLTVSPDGRFIAAATGRYVQGVGHETDVEIFDLHKGTHDKVSRQPGEVLGMWQVRFSATGLLATTSQKEGKSGIIVVDVLTMEVVFRQGQFESYWVRGLSISSDGRFLVTGDEKGWVRLWDVTQGRLLSEQRESLPVQSTAIGHENIAWSLWDGTVKLQDLTHFVQERLLNSRPE